MDLHILVMTMVAEDLHMNLSFCTVPVSSSSSESLCQSWTWKNTFIHKNICTTCSFFTKKNTLFLMTMTILFSWFWWSILAKSKLLLWSFLSPAPSPLPSMASLGSDSLMKYLYKLQSISNDLWEILEYSAITKWRSSAMTVSGSSLQIPPIWHQNKK